MVKLFVAFATLFLHIVLDHGEIAVLPHGVCVVSLGPEVASPEFLLDFGMCFEYMACCDAFDFLHYV